MNDRARQPKGVPAGGQYAAQVHGEADVDLPGQPTRQPPRVALDEDLLRRDLRDVLETAGVSGVHIGHRRVRAITDAMVAAAAAEVEKLADMEPVPPPLGMFSDEANWVLDEAIRPLEVACFNDRVISEETSAAIAEVQANLAAAGHGEAFDTSVGDAIWHRLELACRRRHSVGPPGGAPAPPTV